MNRKCRLFAFVLLTLSSFAFVMAQDDNEFQRIAKRVMDAYDIGEDLATTPDSGRWYGGAYLGANSKGHAMPSAYMTYQVKGKYLVTANLAFDFGEVTTSRDIDNQFAAGGYQNTGTNFLTNTEKSDMSVRLDTRVGRGGIFTFGLLETINRQKVRENSIKSGMDAQGQHTESVYEEQYRDANDKKFGSLIQYIYDFQGGGRLTSRLNLKYNSMPTTIHDDIWSVSVAKASREQVQELKNFDPYALLDFQSAKKNGFSWGFSEKYVINNMTISDSETEFDYDSYSSLSTLQLGISHAWFSAKAKGTFENFHHRIYDHVNEKINSTEQDWMATGSMSAKASKHNTLTVSYERNIKRPTYTQLYPFVHIGSGIGAKVVGNPNLQPSCTQQYKLTHSYTGKYLSLTTGLAYKHTSDDITSISSFDNQTQTAVRTWVNDATYDNLRFTLEGRLRISCLDITSGFHAQYLDYSGENVAGDQTWAYSFKVRPEIKLPQDWTLATSFVYTGREVHSTYYDRSNIYWSFRAVKELGPWALYAFVQDILQEDRVRVLKNEKNTMLTSNDLNGRCLIIGCSYIF